MEPTDQKPTTKSGKPLSRQQLFARRKVERGVCRICTLPVPGRPELFTKIPTNKIVRIFDLAGVEVVGRKTSQEELTTADGAVIKISDANHDMLTCSMLLGQLCIKHKKKEREAVRKKKGFRQRYLYAGSYSGSKVDPKAVLRDKIAQDADEVRQARLRAESPDPQPENPPWQAKFVPAPKRKAKPKAPDHPAKPKPTSLAPPERKAQ